MKIKTLTSALAVAGFGVVLGIGGGSSAKAEEFTAVSWGGAYSESQSNAYIKPYTQANPDVKINFEDYSGGLAEVRAQSEAGNVTWDLVDVIYTDAVTGCDEGLFLEIDFDDDLARGEDGSRPTQDFLPEALGSPCFIPQIAYSTTFGFRSDLVSPETVADVFDLDKFPGKRGLQKVPTYNLEWALIADGVDKDDVYDVLSTPEGVDRAFAKLDTIKDSVVWWEAGAQPPQLLADGEVVIASAYNGRLFAAIEEEKQPIAMLWDGQALDLDGWAIAAGSEHIDAVKKFVRYATDTQRLADQAKWISYGPLRKSSLPLVGKHADLGIDMAPHMPTKYADQ
ncbi:MAG: ABC transporter substrate-binding protein, partial [Hyphomicrobiales bacterium]|nr:ABC transporter substrate-binding protein [Hyphomicrobiales bacterium]